MFTRYARSHLELSCCATHNRFAHESSEIPLFYVLIIRYLYLHQTTANLMATSKSVAVADGGIFGCYASYNPECELSDGTPVERLLRIRSRIYVCRQLHIRGTAFMAASFWCTKTSQCKPTQNSGLMNRRH